MDATIEAILGGQPIPESTPAATPAEPISTPAQSSAPVAGKEGEPGTTPIPAGTEPAKSGQAAPAVSDEQLLTAAGLTENPEKKLGRLERDYAASGKEAKRLLEFSKGLEDILKDQGADIAKDEQGRPVGLIANKKYSKEMASLDIKVKDLPDEIQAEFESEPQKVVDFIVEKAKKAMTRAMPTTDKFVVPLSPERHEAAVNYLADMKWETGDAKFPGLAANRKLIEQMINAPTASKALKEFYYQDPETALALLNLQLDHARSYISEQAKKAVATLEAKRLAAETNPQPVPSGGGVPGMGVAGEDDLASQVAHAKLGY